VVNAPFDVERFLYMAHVNPGAHSLLGFLEETRQSKVTDYVGRDRFRLA
jgi:hypothetical protein